MELKPSTGWATFVEKEGNDVAHIIFKEESTWIYRLRELILVRVKTTVEKLNSMMDQIISAQLLEMEFRITFKMYQFW